MARKLKVAVTGTGIKGSPDGREGWAVRAHVPALKALPARAINEGHECTPSFRDKLKIHRVWDAAEESVRTRSWRQVDYSGV